MNNYGNTNQYPWNGGIQNNQISSPNYQQPAYGYAQQVPAQPSYLFGKVVNDPNQITPNEVPMNGSPGFFPTPDYSSIYLKAWNSNGSINTIKFVPEVQNTEPKEDPLKEVLERLDRIEKSIASGIIRSERSQRPQNGKKADDNV